jgi:hypothetical protein
MFMSCMVFSHGRLNSARHTSYYIYIILPEPYILYILTELFELQTWPASWPTCFTNAVLRNRVKKFDMFAMRAHNKKGVKAIVSVFLRTF